jgi:hypothetical protein
LLASSRRKEPNRSIGQDAVDIEEDDFDLLRALFGHWLDFSSRFSPWRRFGE